ncbi:hypothetical protein D3C87_1861110 [compost metagenome]
MNNPSGGNAYRVIAGCKRCWRKSNPAVKSVWRVAVEPIIGRDNYRHADFG